MNDLVVTIRSLRRVEYLKKCLASLEANAGLEDVDFYMYQDGAVNPFSGRRHATDERVAASLQVFEESKLPNKTIVVKDHNVGTAIQKTEMLDNLFPKYRFVMMLDNDLVFNKYYIKTILTLFRQFESRPEVGMLQTSYFYDEKTQPETPAFARKHADLVDYGFGQRWEQGFWRKKWGRIYQEYKPYVKLACQDDYKEMLLYNKPPFRARKRTILKQYGTVSTDFILEKCVTRAGYKGIHTMALRHRTVGRDGIYSDAKKFDRMKMGGAKVHAVGNADTYRFWPEVRSRPKRGAVKVAGSLPSDWMELVYEGSDTAPFTIRGQVSKKKYWRVQKGEPFPVLRVDVPFFMKHGFKST